MDVFKTLQRKKKVIIFNTESLHCLQLHVLNNKDIESQ